MRLVVSRPQNDGDPDVVRAPRHALSHLDRTQEAAARLARPDDETAIAAGKLVGLPGKPPLEGLVATTLGWVAGGLVPEPLSE